MWDQELCALVSYNKVKAFLSLYIKKQNPHCKMSFTWRFSYWLKNVLCIQFYSYLRNKVSSLLERKYSHMHPRSSLKLLDATNKLLRCPTTTLTINTSFSLAVSSSSRLDRFIWSMAISSSWLLFSLSLSDPCNFVICSFIDSSCLSAKLALYIDSNKFSKLVKKVFF